MRDGGIDIHMQPAIMVGSRSRGPGLLAGIGARRADPRQMRPVNPLVSSRHKVVVYATCPNTWDRSPHNWPTPSTQSAPSATAAARSANISPAHGSTARGRYLPTPW